ncbi:hypothetical protein F5148DRAFT_1282546 [Russula earlei]|uniref:Uncharacterized protein n=1 Tax=Russula earlei TaxID=71964 RepID=A0ACC0UDK6_9AGAM|nr:hypothetical protein F5148DRAFT_1282546 [Russula earlei]
MPPCSLPLTFDAHSLSSASNNVTTITSMSPTHAPPPVAFAFIPPAIINPILPTAAISLPIASIPASVHAPAFSATSTSTATPTPPSPHMTAIFTSSAIVTAPASPTIITVTASVTPSPFIISTPMPTLPTAIPSLSTTAPSVTASRPLER